MTIVQHKVEQTTLGQLSLEDRDRCRYLNFGNQGQLRQLILYGKSERLIFLVRGAEGDVVGWAGVWASGQAGFYVARSHRKQGIGRALAEAARAVLGDSMVVRPHDRGSWALLGRYTDEQPTRYDLTYDYKGYQP